jgi:hypothetical protein
MRRSVAAAASSTGHPADHELRCQRVTDDAMQRLRTKLAGEPMEKLPKAFLSHVMGSWSLDASFAHLVFASQALGIRTHMDQSVRSQARAATTPRGNRRRVSVFAEMMFAPSQTRKVPWTFEEAAAAVEHAWAKQRATTPFEDEIYLVLVSPQDPDDYVAIGGKRLCEHARPT